MKVPSRRYLYPALALLAAAGIAAVLLLQAFSQESSRDIRRAAEKGEAAAQYKLGFRYAQGLNVLQDYKEAQLWFLAAAQQGHAKAQYQRGVMYTRSRDALQDYGEAAHWLRQAAQQGDAAAQIELGFLYDQGQGVPQDYA